MADALAPGRVHQRAHRLKLVVAREDHRFLLHLAALVVALLLDLQVDEPRQQVEEAVPLQHLLPQVGRAIGAPRRVGRVAGAAVAPFVEGQEVRRRPCQPRGHEHRFGVHGEVHQRAALELEDRLARIAVLLVLPARLFHRLAGERVLQLQRGDGDAVQAEGDIERLLRARREVQLPGQPQAVRGVARLQLRVELVRRLEVGRVQRPPIALEAMAQRRQRAVGVHPLAQVAEDLLAGLLPVQRLQPGPLLRLGGTDEGQYGLGKDRPLAVEAVPVHGHVAVGEQMGFDDGFEGSFAMPLAHTFAPSARPSGFGAGRNRLRPRKTHPCLCDHDKTVGQLFCVLCEQAPERLNLVDRPLVCEAEEYHASVPMAFAIDFFPKIFVIGEKNPVLRERFVYDGIVDHPTCLLIHGEDVVSLCS